MSEREHHHHKMRYEEPPYFLVGLSILMIGWGLLSYVGLVGGSVWIAWGGAILLIISVSTFYTRRATARTVFGTLQSHEGEKIQLSKLADELDMSEKDLRSAMIDLRAEGRVKVGFDKNTGDVVIGEPKEIVKAPRAPGFCAYCSYPLPPGARFCPSCGSSVE
nr:zinc ribbon domain-containing protein [Candidatus Njordarchaeota archaeon]